MKQKLMETHRVVVKSHRVGAPARAATTQISSSSSYREGGHLIDRFASYVTRTV